MSKMIFPLGFERQFKGPLDVDLVFDTDVQLQAYLTNGLRYAGMLVTCKEHEGSLFIMNNAENAWIHIEGIKGDVGFTPIPEITETAGGIFLNWIIGYDTNNDPIYKWVTGLNIKGKDGTNDTDNGPGHMDVNLVVSTNIGMYEDGQIIAKDTPILDVVKNMLTTVKNPTYTQPLIETSTTQQLLVESGTTITPEILSTFTQNDAGTLSAFRVKENGVVVLNDVAVSPYTAVAHRIIDTTETYIAEVDYLDGPVKKTNLGAYYPAGQIIAGTKVSTPISITGARKAFYGIDTASKIALSTSDEVRLLNSIMNVSEGTTIEIFIPQGTQKVTFAYPETLRDVSAVKYIEFANSEVKDIFQKTVVAVEGAEGGNAINYKLYTFIPAVPFQKDVNYKITI